MVSYVFPSRQNRKKMLTNKQKCKILPRFFRLATQPTPQTGSSWHSQQQDLCCQWLSSPALAQLCPTACLMETSLTLVVFRPSKRERAMLGRALHLAPTRNAAKSFTLDKDQYACGTLIVTMWR
ncbi:hypothetical protein DVH05_010378 [Phytophthora capsici]|nr:hypothetical protein DVH05_010378 [Phytophthora capsici]